MSEKDFCKDANGVNASVKAQQWANELVRREARGPGDMENAMRRLESRYGIPWRMFWSLRYRPPTDVLAGLFFKLQDAYRAECDRQMRLLRHETEITRIIAGPDAPAVRKAEALVGAFGHHRLDEHERGFSDDKRDDLSISQEAGAKD